MSVDQEPIIHTQPEEVQPEPKTEIQETKPVVREEVLDVKSGGLMGRLGKKGVAIVAGAGVALAGGVAGAVMAFGPRGGEETPAGPAATGSATPGEATPSPSATQTENESVEKDPLSPINLWKMSPEERLEAIKIGEEYLDNPEGYVKRFEEIQTAIYNAGTTDEEHSYWRDTDLHDRYPEYGDYIFETYHRPLLEQLWGSEVNTNMENSPPRWIAELVDVSATGRRQGLTMDYFKVNCTASNIQVEAGGTIDDTVTKFTENCTMPTTDEFDELLPNLFEESRVAWLVKVLATLREAYSNNEVTLVNPHYSNDTGVQPGTLHH